MITFRILAICLLIMTVPLTSFAEVYEVIIDDIGFQPSALTISLGDTVKWVNKGTSLHSVTSGSDRGRNGHFDSGLLNSGVSFEYTFSLPGGVSYFDRASIYNSGTIIVENNRVIISPSSSVLLTQQSFDLVIFIDALNISYNRIHLVYNGIVIFDGDLDSLLELTNSSRTEITESGVPIIIPIPPFTFSTGVHTLTAKIITASGQEISDTARYEVTPRLSFSPQTNVKLKNNNLIRRLK